MNQTKLESLIEVFFNYLSGFLLAWAVYAWIIIPSEELKNSAFTATCIFTAVSILRTYFCDKLLPILTIKRDRAELIKEFQTIKSTVGNQPISDEVYDKTVELYNKFRELNKRGVEIDDSLT